MTIRMRVFAFLPLATAGCTSGSSVQYTNDTTAAQLSEISSNTSEADGKTPAVAPVTPDEVGQSMRAGAATKPRP